MTERTQSRKERAEASRLKAEQLRKEAEAKSRRNRTLIVAITVAVLAALVVGVVIVVQNARREAAAAAAGPAGLSEHGGLLSGEAAAPVTVTVYADYLCPNCKHFETENAAMLEEMKAAGDVKIEYVPVAILDRLSNGTNFSSRAASAAYCAIESDPDKFPAFNQALFDNQPGENTPGLTTEQIVTIAEGAGVGPAGRDCIKADTYTGYATKVTEQASKDGMPGTPYVLVNGEKVEQWTKDNLKAAIDKAKGN